MEKQVIDNILSICSTFIAAILGVAYPIILNTISRIGEKYSSKHLPILFSEEFPQRLLIIRVGNRLINITFFNAILYSTLLSALFLILYSNIYVYLAVLTITTSFVIIFIIWASKVIKYSGNLQSIISFLIEEHNKYKDKDEKKSKKIIEALNEITLYAVKIGDDNLQGELYIYYTALQKKIIENHNKQKALLLPDYWYKLTTKICREIENRTSNLSFFDSYVVSGRALICNITERYRTIISEETYQVLWKNAIIICKNPLLVKEFWETSYQYYYDFLGEVEEENITINDEYIVTNKEAIEQRNKERERYQNFFYSFGGLLLYKKEYYSLHFILSYAPANVFDDLRPNDITKIINWFVFFSKDITQILNHTQNKSDDNFKPIHISESICQFIAVTLISHCNNILKYNTTLNLSKFNIPNSLIEIYSLIKELPFLQHNIVTVFNNQKLLEKLEFQFIKQYHINDILYFINDLRNEINIKAEELKSNYSIFKENSINFQTHIAEIFAAGTICYDKILLEKKELNSNIVTEGFNFSPEHLNINYFFYSKERQKIGKNKYHYHNSIKHYYGKAIIQAYLKAKTKLYTFNKDILLNAIKRIINYNNDILIIGFDTKNDIVELFEDSKYKNQCIFCNTSNICENNTLFIINRNTLPAIENIDIPTHYQQKNHLKCIDPKLKLYTYVEYPDVSRYTKIERLQNNRRYKDYDLIITVKIQFLAKLYWKKNREVIQIDVASQYKEQGILNSVSDVKPLSKLPQ